MKKENIAGKFMSAISGLLSRKKADTVPPKPGDAGYVEYMANNLKKAIKRQGDLGSALATMACAQGLSATPWGYRIGDYYIRENTGDIVVRIKNGHYEPVMQFVDKDVFRTLAEILSRSRTNASRQR